MKTPAPQINARIENLTSSNVWKKAFIGRRAIVPMLGYYEWKAIAGKKQPYFIHSDPDFLSAAGIYVPVKTGDDWEVRFAIITREARDASGEIHDRMPAFLTPDTSDTWLAPEDLGDPAEALGMLKASSEQVAASITTYPSVGRSTTCALVLTGTTRLYSNQLSSLKSTRAQVLAAGGGPGIQCGWRAAQ